VHGRIEPERGFDELTTATVNSVVGFGRLRDIDARWTPEQFGLARAAPAELAGGTVRNNLTILEALLAGRGPRGLEDTIVFNAAAALWIVGRVATVQAGLVIAREQLLGGGVRAKIAAAKEFYGPA
jgi:anthranilate phosphoribosyltransferase